ncbi:hypothetical protein AOU28_27420 [Pseudomonas aeruginosa]|nr:hypothetical protein AOU28_27420 [Pseudomonas aeruginosa]
MRQARRRALFLAHHATQRRQSPSTFIPLLRRTSQCNQHPGCATLYLDSSAASEDLFDTGRRRLELAIGTLSVLDPAGRVRVPPLPFLSCAGS